MQDGRKPTNSSRPRLEMGLGIGSPPTVLHSTRHEKFLQDGSRNALDVVSLPYHMLKTRPMVAK